jgi:hypothetical protein
MLKVAACAVAAAAVVLVSVGVAAQPAPKPSATPFVLGTLEPFGATAAPFATSLPEIGRTRSITPACAAMRDLIIPSFQAALRADQRFAETRKRLPTYVDYSTDPSHRDDAFGQMVLHKLDADVSALLQESLVLNKALGDPRLSADNKDPQVVAERRAMQQLYDSQQTRANLLSEFVIRERAASARQGIDDGGAFQSRLTTNVNSPVLRSPAPLPALTAPPGMPLRSGIPMADKNAVTDWSTSIAVYVRKNENDAARTFYRIAQGCRS